MRLFTSSTVILLLAVFSIACASSHNSGTTTVPTLNPVLTHELEVIVEPTDTAIVLLNPKPIGDREYVHGRTVTIEVLPKPGWEVDRWLGPVSEIAGSTAKINMTISHSLMVSLVPSSARLPTKTPNLVGPATKPPMPTPQARRVSSPIPVRVAPAKPTTWPVATVVATSTPRPAPAGTPTPVPTRTLIPTPTPVPTFIVTKTADTYDGTCDADCSLREATIAAGQGATVRIPAGVYTLRIQELTISKDLTLIGDGPQNTIIQAANSPETAGHGVFDIERKNIVTISGVTIRHGNTAFGGGITNDGTLTLIDNSVIGNLAENGGGIHNTGSLTLINTVASGNTAAQYGGGIYNDGAVTLQDSLISDNEAVRRYGGGIYHHNSQGKLTITRTTISGNKAHYGGGINGGPFTMTDSTVSGNASNSNGGGIHGGGTLLNSVLSGNTAREDGGGLAGAGKFTNVTISGNIAGQRGGGIFSDSNPLFLTNSTMTLNEASVDGGGVYSEEGLVVLRNTIIAENSSTRKGPQCYGDITSKGHNIVGDKSDCTLLATTGDQLGTNWNSIDPRLGPLQGNGGPTDSHGLSLDSPAIDAADNANCPVSDQRGASRPKGAACDIGSYEN